MLKKLFSMERISLGDKVLNIFFYLILLALLIVCAYPVYFVLIASVSTPAAVDSGRLLLYPEGFHLDGYKYVIEDSRILSGYMNTLIYTVSGTLWVWVSRFPQATCSRARTLWVAVLL